MFNSRKQQEGESVEEFVRALNILVNHCNYADTDEQVRGRLVIGLNDLQLKEKLQLQGDLTLEKAVTIARQQEQIKHQIKEQTKQLEQLDIEEACRRGHGSGSCHDTGRGRVRSRGFYGNNTAGGTRKYHRVVHSSPSVQRSKTNCGKCGYEHRDDVCPAQGQRCRQCSGRNHFGRMCKQRA